MTREKTALQFAATLLGFAVSSFAQPDWLKQAAHQAARLSHHKDANAIILHHTAEVVMAAGKTKSHIQKAVLVLKTSGESHGVLVVAIAPFREIKNLKGWTVQPDGDTRSLSKDHIAQMSASEPTDDNHVLIAKLEGIRIGSIAAFEYDIEETGVTSSYQSFVFQEQTPVRLVRFSVLVPKNWALHEAAWHMDGLYFTREGERYVWVGRDLPYRAEEPLMPSWRYLARRLALVGFDSAATNRELFRSWPSVANWCAQIHDPSARPDATVSERARVLTQGASTPEMKLEKIAAFVRDEIRYVAVELGIERWQPRTATETLYNRYGDCKDKTALMRALLEAVHIPSVPVLANTEYAVRPTLPTPFQFNHCIIAIPTQALPELTPMPNATANGWLFFDPTDPAARLGDLPVALQGDLVLLATQSDSLLQRLPYRTVENYRRRYRAHASLSPEGELLAEVRITDSGDYARASQYLRGLTSPDKQMEEWRAFFSQAVPTATLAEYQTGAAGDSAWVSFQLHSPSYPKSAGNFLLLKVNFFQPSQPPALFAEHREHPIWFGPAQHEEFGVTWTIPRGWMIEEAPATIDNACATASLQCRIETSGNTLHFQSVQQQNGRLLPVEEYVTARKLSQDLSLATKATVFLKQR